jgi:biotin operon repressor
VRHVSEPQFLVLHSLRLKGFATEPAVADLTGLSRSDVDTHLAMLRADGYALYRDGRVTGWTLTAAGRDQHMEHLAVDLAHADCRSVVEHAYGQFLAVNHQFLTACTAWQVRASGRGEQVFNDHSDPLYDANVIGRLRAIDTSVQPACGELATAMARFAGYGPRLAAALARVENGEQEWFTGALIESYHTVWFQLHEDLLATLGIKREKEGAH